MKKIIIVKIEYSHNDNCKSLETHDSWDCGCGLGEIENEEYIMTKTLDD